MTRILIIGSGHVAAYKQAADAFEKDYPGSSLDVFGLQRDPLFKRGRLNEDGIFQPPFRNDEERTSVEAINGSATKNVTGYDHLLFVGHRFAFTRLPLLLEDHDILGGMRTGRPRVMTESMVVDTVHAVTRAAVKDVLEKVDACGRPVTFAMAPYPAAKIVDHAPGLDLARLLKEFWARPDASWLFDLWLSTLRDALAEQGHALLEQPQDLTAGPFATKAEFASRAIDLGGRALDETDHLHMNAYFGLAMLRRYAETHLGLATRPRAKPAKIKTLRERTA